MSDWPRWIYWVLLVISLAFTLGGFAIAVVTREAEGWLAALFFGACTAVAITSLWPQLLLDRHLSRDDLLARFPGPVELRASPRRGLFLLPMSLAFAAVLACILFVDEGWSLSARILLWPGLILFGGGSLLMLVMLIRRPSLTLSAEGLLLENLWRRGQMRWTEIGDFAIWSDPVAGMPLVVFDDRTGRGPATGRFDRALSGRNAGRVRPAAGGPRGSAGAVAGEGAGGGGAAGPVLTGPYIPFTSATN